MTTRDTPRPWRVFPTDPNEKDAEGLYKDYAGGIQEGEGRDPEKRWVADFYQLADAERAVKAVNAMPELVAMLERLLSEIDDINGPRPTALSPGGILYADARSLLDRVRG